MKRKRASVQANTQNYVKPSLANSGAEYSNAETYTRRETINTPGVRSTDPSTQDPRRYSINSTRLPQKFRNLPP